MGCIVALSTRPPAVPFRSWYGQGVSRLVGSGVVVLAVVLFGAVRAPSSAFAREATLAVLPLEKGAGSEAYEGLGKALAGMIVTDLSSISGLQLVERERLRELMAEIELNKTGYLEPSTAQKLGRGVGAAFLVTGSYSVVAKTFLMDARIVRVESGKVVKASNAQGTVDDFVAVEKDVVEGLLEGLDIKLSGSAKRKLFVQTPTEKFEAFSEYGRGLERQDQGKVDDAREAFERALSIDPAFEEARKALTSMRRIVDTAKAEDRARLTRSKDAAHQSVLDAYPSERERADDYDDSVQDLAGFALRLMVLENEGRHCERLKAMRHFLERKAYRVRAPRDRRSRTSFEQIVERAAESHGLRRLDRSIAKVEAATDDPEDRAELFRSTYDFILDREDRNPGLIQSGLLGSIRRCLEPKRQLIAIDRLAKAVRLAGVDVQYRPKGPRSPYNLGQALDLVWCWIRGTELGADDALSRRTKKLLAAAEDDPELKRDVLSNIERILQKAEMLDQQKQRQLRIAPQQLERTMRAVAKGKSKRLRLGSPSCKALYPMVRGQARRWVVEYDREASRPEPDTFRLNVILGQAGPVHGALRDLGCLAGRKARFKSPDQIVRFFGDIGRYGRPEKRSDENCISAFEGIQTTVDSVGVNWKSFPPASKASVAASLVWMYESMLVAQGCVARPK